MGAKDAKDLAILAAIVDTPGLNELQRQAKQISEMIEAFGNGHQLEEIRAGSSAQEPILNTPGLEDLQQQVQQQQERMSDMLGATGIGHQIEAMQAANKAILGDPSIKDMQRQAEQAAQMLKDLGFDRRAEALETITSARAGFASMLETNASALVSAIERSRLAFDQSPWDLSSPLTDLQPLLEEASRASAQGIATFEGLQSIAATYLDSLSEVASRLGALEWPVNLLVTSVQHEALLDMSAVLKQHGHLIEYLKDFSRTEGCLMAPALATSAETGPLLVIPGPPAPESRRGASLARGEGMRELTLAKVCLALRLWNEAEHHSSEAVEWRPDDPEPHVGRGIALNALERFDESIAAFALAEEKGADFSGRPDVRAVYEASLQRRRWDGQLAEDDKPKN